MRYGLALVVGLALLCSHPVAAQSYKAEFTNSLVTAANTSWGEAAIKFADLVKDRTQGRITVKNYFSGQLFARKQTNEFTLLKEGTDVVFPTAAEIDGLRAKTRAVYVRWASDIGADLVKSAEQVIARTR